jgi:hypothetical protein
VSGVQRCHRHVRTLAGWIDLSHRTPSTSSASGITRVYAFAIRSLGIHISCPRCRGGTRVTHVVSGVIVSDWTTSAIVIAMDPVEALSSSSKGFQISPSSSLCRGPRPGAGMLQMTPRIHNADGSDSGPSSGSRQKWSAFSNLSPMSLALFHPRRV